MLENPFDVPHPTPRSPRRARPRLAWIPWVLIATVFVGTPLVGQESPTSVDQRLSALIEALGSSDPEVHRRFFEQHCVPGDRPMEQRVGTLGRIVGLTGGLDVHRVSERSDDRLVALAQQRSDQRWVRLLLDHESEAPFRVVSFGLELTSPPLDAVAGAPLDLEGLKTELAELVGSRVADGSFSGAVRVSHGTTLLFEGAAGLAERRFGVANQLDTRFNLGSVNKSFTAVAIGQLVDRGLVDFDDRLVDLVPGLPRPERLSDITLAHLLSHRSGLGSYWQQLFATNFGNIRSHRQLVDLAIDQDPDFDAGSRFQYSNLGYVLLGRVIEEVSGLDYFEYMRRHVFAPAGMNDTDSWAADDPVAGLATGYTRQTDGTDHGVGPWRSNLFLHSAQGCAAGGGYSTVGDLHRFVVALWGDRLVEPETRARLHHEVAGLGDARGYGLGFGIRGEGPLRNIGHNGGAPGISADYRHYPELGVTVAVLANIDGGARQLPTEVEALLARWRSGAATARGSAPERSETAAQPRG